MNLKTITKKAEKTWQEEQYEPITVSNEVTAELEAGDDVQEVGDVLYHIAMQQCNVDLLKRTMEAEMDPETLSDLMAENPVVVDGEVVLPGEMGVFTGDETEDEEDTIPPWVGGDE